MGYIVTSKSTVTGYKTPHGFYTPHKYPQDTEVNQTDIQISLTRQLYPTGRAFYILENSQYEKLHKGFNVAMIRFIEDIKLLIDKSIPDNSNFEEQDANLWENRLGLTIDPSTELENRKLAIKRKMSYPSNIKARQHPKFIEWQLQQAGFEVFVHENIFFENGKYTHKTPDEVLGLNKAITQHGNDLQHGSGVQHGAENFDIIANRDEKETYRIGGNQNLWATFFISGQNLSETATVPQNREREFRELVLKLKPAHTVAYLILKFL